MQFKLQPARRRDRSAEAPTFTVERLWSEGDGGETEVSHLIDRTYRYHSLRELQWHLAERFSLPREALALRRA